MQNSLIGKMVKRLKRVKSTATKTVALGLLLGMITTSTTGCFFNFNKMGDKETSSITPDETHLDLGDSTEIDGPETGDATETEKPLETGKLPEMDTETSNPDLGNATEGEEDIKKPETETDKTPETEKETEIETENSDKDEDVEKDLDKAQNIIGKLKSAINTELEEYFNDTKTTNSSKFTVSDIVFIEANDKGIDIGFTTKTSAGKEGYSVINVGSLLDSENIKTLVGDLTSKDYLIAMGLKDLQSLVDICKSAVSQSGISSNIDSYYLIPVTTNVSDLGNLVISYYKTISPNGENCKQTEDGYVYSANVLTFDVNGKKLQTVSDISTARLGRNQYFDLINDAIEDLTNKNESELGL